MNQEAIRYAKRALNPFLFKTGMLYKLPSVVFWGIKIVSLDEHSCSVNIPYSWRTKNPFKSIYFAALAGAAELSTGALCQLMLAGKSPHAMLVVDFRAEYFKKADSAVIFTCNQGKELESALQSLVNPGDTTQFKMVSTGFNQENKLIVKITVTWSFKRK
ncbi:MAG: DUF4442 domain-containing protein [Saprospiraceae bacterium]|nr:DUF4442 domain-containing protein [Saprospiraceae bacterium]